MQKLLELIRLGGRLHALAQLQCSLLRGRPVASRTREQPALVSRDRQPLAGELVRHGRGKPRDVLPAQRGERRDRRTCSSRYGSNSPRPRESRRRPRHTAPPGGSRPWRSRAISGLRTPGRLDRQRRRPLVADQHEQIGFARAEHELQRVVPVAACLRGVERRAAADDRDAPSGSRRSVGTWDSHSGCTAIAFRVRAPATPPSIP